MKSGWQISTLGNVLAVLRNGVNCKQDKSGKGDKISRIESISDATFDLAKVGYADLNERDKERYRLQPGDILFSHINSAVHVGKTAVFDTAEPVYHGVNLLLMRPKDVVTPAYLDYALKYLFQNSYWLGVCKQSVNQASVNQQDISRVEIRYPESLPEQRRIVGVLDEAFDGIATAKANAEKNLQNARAIFESHLQSVFAQRGSGWVEKPLGALCSFENGDRGTNYPSKSARTAKGIPFINAGHLTDKGIDFETMDYIPKERFNLLGAGKIRAGDILFCLRGSLGKFANVGDLSEGAIASSLVIVRTEKAVLNGFVLAYFRSHLCAEMIKKFKTGAAQPNLSANNLRKFIVPVPRLPEQQSIISKLDELSAETNYLESIYHQKLAALDALKKSLLHQAFSGQLSG